MIFLWKGWTSDSNHLIYAGPAVFKTEAKIQHTGACSYHLGSLGVGGNWKLIWEIQSGLCWKCLGWMTYSSDFQAGRYNERNTICQYTVSLCVCIYNVYMYYMHTSFKELLKQHVFFRISQKKQLQFAETKKKQPPLFGAKLKALRRNNSKPCSACRKFHACRPNSYSARAFCSRSPSNWGTCHTCGSKWTNPEILTICVGWTYLK